MAIFVSIIDLVTWERYAISRKFGLAYELLRQRLEGAHLRIGGIRETPAVATR